MRIFSGMQPTAALHLGNYLGALRNWVVLQRQQPEAECLFCVVDLHALTVPQEPARLRQAIREVAAAYIAAGVDPARALIYPQSAVPGHTELAWYLGTMAPLGWLNRMTQFKEKAGKDKEAAGLGLYSYPVLMAADILLFKATHVPVGEDQKQHLELARDLAGAFNRFVDAETFPLPEPMILGEATRVMSLRDGTKKMSKSDISEYSRIALTDDADTIRLKIRKAKTDPEPLPLEEKGLEGRPEADNLVTIFGALSDKTKAQVLAEHGSTQFSAFKAALADLAVEVVGPIAAEMNRLLGDIGELDRLLMNSADRARAIAEPTLAEVRDRLGLLPLRAG